MGMIGPQQRTFEEMIDAGGKMVTWQEAYKCSCWNIQSGSPNYECKACNGSGYVYRPPLTIKALLTGIDTKKDFLPAGEWRVGDIACTVTKQMRVGDDWVDNPMWAIGEGDIVSLSDSEQKTSEVLIKGMPLWRRPADTLLHPAAAILDITSLLTTNPDTGDITYFVPGVRDTDFTETGGVVTWDPASIKDFTVIGNVVHFNPNGTYAAGLTDGSRYSVTYRHFMSYIVYMALPNARDYYAQHFPKKVMLKLRGGDAL
jgi:hypothetical protein